MNDLPEPPLKEPETFAELFRFYHDYVKVLYSLVQTRNVLPQETLFELNAALDHLSRCWIYGETEAQVVKKAFGHLKRSCLDIFKLAARDAHDQYSALRRLDTSAIDNGDFEKGLHALFARIKRNATQARHLEGDGRRNDEAAPIKAFDAWQPVLRDCLVLERDYFHHPRLDWAKRRWLRRFWLSSLVSALLAFVAGFIGRTYADDLLAWFRGVLQ